MKNLKLLFALAVVISASTLSPAVHASGIINITGKVTTITEGMIVLETEKSIYYLKRSLIEPSETQAIKKIQTQVTLAVPFEAVDRVKPKNKKKAS